MISLYNFSFTFALSNIFLITNLTEKSKVKMKTIETRKSFQRPRRAVDMV